MFTKNLNYWVTIKAFASILTLGYLMAFSCSDDEEETPPNGDFNFNLTLAPSIVQPIIPGQELMLLLKVTNTDQNLDQQDKIHISANATGATCKINPQNAAPGTVVEIVVTPSGQLVDQNLEVKITAQRQDVTHTTSKTLEVIEGIIEDYLGLEPEAAAYRDRFVEWLATNHSELGIDSITEWDGKVTTPRWLVVSHYLFFSDEWEMMVGWHIMIPPYDWTEIYLRKRFDDLTPTYGFKIDSRSNVESLPYECTPQEEVWR
jgi:hypothetical protein